MERHHAAERHLYPEIVQVLQQIKQENPCVLIGAVTDGKANPLFMTFTLAPYFDFCVSWEDDQGARKKFFQELSDVDGNAELKWIYDLALEKYQQMAASLTALGKASDCELGGKNKLWIHVGDDLAYDVGGSAQSGAHTIYLELADKYEQTARHRFKDTKDSSQPSWSTTSRSELEKRRVMNELAESKVDAKIQFLSRLPEAINEILERENEKVVETVV
jgi:FMN phosphatase YigB (HAD superfamily)